MVDQAELELPAPFLPFPPRHGVTGMRHDEAFAVLRHGLTLKTRLA